MHSGFKKLMEKDRITLTDVYDLVNDIYAKVNVAIQISLIIGFVLGAIFMAIVDIIIG